MTSGGRAPGHTSPGHRLPRGLRWGLGLLVAAALCLALPTRVSAHAILLSSEPEQGAQLGTAPGTVVLHFSEPVDRSLSSATVTDPLGHPTTAQPVGVAEIRVNLVTNVPGLYRVGWTSVSVGDGHTLHGTFSFTVQARAPSAAAASTAGLSAGDVALAAARWIEDGAILLALGMLLIGWLGRRDPPLEWARPRLIVPLVIAALAGTSVISAESLSASGGSVAGTISYFTSGSAEIARVIRVLLELLAIAAVAGGARALAPVIVAPAIALAAAGHGAAAEPAWWGISIDAIHLLAAGAWAGGIIALATLRPPGGWRAEGRALLARFTPWALLAFGATVSFGVLQALQDVGGFDALGGTAYGRVLLVKIGLVGLTLPFSLAAWRLRRPRLRIEGGIAVAVVGAAALLASFSLPPARSAAAMPAQPGGGTAGLPRGSELTLGDHAGQVLVGLTITPAVPGPNQLRVFVRSPRGAAESASPVVTATVGTAIAPLTACGETCRQGEATLRGLDLVTVHVEGAEGGTSAFRLPALPAPDASRLLARGQARTDALRSHTVHETLTGGGSTTITTDYTAVAPDRVSWTIAGGSSVVWIGTTRYSRETLGGPWIKEESAGTPIVPAFVWDSFSPYVGVHSLGSEVVDGVPITIVGFFGGTASTPVWFKLWIDSEGLVHRAAMRAPGHFMDQAFGNFDAPLTIVPPG